jgi:pimeloyl-ACP methyl ester carboxylesterase
MTSALQAPAGTALQVQNDEARELLQLGVEELAGAIDGLQAISSSVANRAFGLAGPFGLPTRWVYDHVTNAVYGGLRGSARGAGGLADRGLSRRPDWSARVVSTTPPGAAVVAAINGLIGDTLERRQSALHQEMSLRVDGRAIDLDGDGLAAAYPKATPRVAIFVHGLMTSEFSWKLGARRTGETYGSQLERDLGITPVYVRYNTGRHISENGRSLAELLELVMDEWPVEAGEVALIGHSMGGLVARSATHHASLSGMRWPGFVKHSISLGTPHMGAPLEQAVHYASAALSALPETRPFGNFLRRRSAGIRDLRQGSLVDEDWLDRDLDALRAEACTEVPLLAGATHCFVTATVTRSPRHPVGRLIGDYLVLQPSGSGRSRSRRIAFEDEYGLHVGGVNHLALLNHPQVYEKLSEWLYQ